MFIFVVNTLWLIRACVQFSLVFLVAMGVYSNYHSGALLATAIVLYALTAGKSLLVSSFVPWSPICITSFAFFC